MSNLAGTSVALKELAREDPTASLTQPGHMTPVRNARLQYLRGFAAIAVLLYHSAEYMRQIRGDARFMSIFPGEWGVYGVAIFFVLSGYLMARISTNTQPLRFLLDRVLRIYPPMLIAVVAAVLAFLSTGLVRRPGAIALTLFPSGSRDYLLGVEWTLLFEITYYVTIAAMGLAGLKRWLEPLFAIWLSMLVVLGLSGFVTQTNLPTITQLPFHPANAAFLMGFLLPVMLRSQWQPTSTTLYAAAALVAALFLVSSSQADYWVAAFSSSLLVAGALKDSAPVRTGRLKRLGLRLGDGSYALYLTHVPLMLTIGHFLPEKVPNAAAWLLWIVSALALTLVLGPLDLRLHARLTGWCQRLSPRTIALCSVTFLAAFVIVTGVVEINGRIGAKTESAARFSLATAALQPCPTVVRDIESISILNDGRLVVRGYGIDLASPNEDSHIAILQGGRVIGFDSLRRMRANVAKTLSRRDIAAIRFGFAVVSDDPLVCSRGQPEARLILSDGRVASVTSPALDALCPQSNPQVGGKVD